MQVRMTGAKIFDNFNGAIRAIVRRDEDLEAPGRVVAAQNARQSCFDDLFLVVCGKSNGHVGPYSIRIAVAVKILIAAPAPSLPAQQQGVEQIAVKQSGGAKPKDYFK